MDSDFGEKLQEYLTNGPPVNGELNGLNGEYPVNEEENKVEAEQWNNDVPEQSAQEDEQGIPQENNIPVEIVAAS